MWPSFIYDEREKRSSIQIYYITPNLKFRKSSPQKEKGKNPIQISYIETEEKRATASHP